MPTLASFAKGHSFPPVSFDLTSDWVNGYVAAVEDEAISQLGADLVPPMAVAALAIRALLEQSGLPPGTLHAGQELTFAAPVRTGDSLAVTAEIVSRGERAGWVLMSIDLRVDRGRESVMTGRSTVSFPIGEGVAA
ncbi:MAG: MaoC family dehydratase [Dehalococcoidia bacterium]